MANLLLHACCAPCSTFCVEELKPGNQLTIFFSNSNISPKAEYDKRLEQVRKLAESAQLPLVIDTYDHDAWHKAITGFEHEPEGGKRCAKCFAFNLGRAAKYAQDHGFDKFTTSLTISPWKDNGLIFAASQSPKFLKLDFKKGFQRSVQLSRELGLYRQDYCGCEFSMRPNRASQLTNATRSARNESALEPLPRA